MSARNYLVIAHRGASTYAPENTYAAFDLALDLGARHLELEPSPPASVSLKTNLFHHFCKSRDITAEPALVFLGCRCRHMDAHGIQPFLEFGKL